MPTIAPPAPFLRTTPVCASDQLKTSFSPYRRPRRHRGLSMVAVVAAAVVIITPVVGIALVTWGVLTSHHTAAQAERQVNDPTLSDADLSSLGLPQSVTTLFDDDAAAAVVESFDESIVGRTQFTQISLYSDYAVAVVQDIGVPTHLDQYPWQSGRVGTATPRPTPGPTEIGAGEIGIDALAFTAGEVRWSTVAALADQAVELTGVDEGQVTHVIVDRSTFDPELPITIRIYVSGPRSSGFVEATATGDVLAVY